jgi:hypothetical protein
MRRSGEARRRQRGHGVHRQGARADGAQLEARAGDGVVGLLGQRHVVLGQLDALGEQQPLRADALVRERGLHAVEHHALVGRVLVQHHQAVLAFAHDEHLAHLPQHAQAAEHALRREEHGIAGRGEGGACLEHAREAGLRRLPTCCRRASHQAHRLRHSNGERRPRVGHGRGAGREGRRGRGTQTTEASLPEPAAGAAGRPAEGLRPQLLSEHPCDRLVGGRAGGEAHLALLRVRVHVHLFGGQVHVQHARREPPRRDHAAVGERHGARERRVPHRPPVHEQVEVLCPRARPLRRAERCPNTQARALPLDALQRLVAEVGLRAREPVLGRQPLAHAPLVAEHVQPQLGVGQRHATAHVHDVAGLGLPGLQELPPRRHRMEQVAHADGGTGRAPHGLQGLHVPAMHAHAHALHVLGPPRGQLEPADRRDGGQRLAPKPQRLDVREIVERADLAGGVPLDGQRRVRGPHTVPVVVHHDAVHAALEDGDRDGRGPCVERVFQQLFHHAGRPLDDLARCDLVDQRVVQQPDARLGLTHGNPGTRGGLAPQRSRSLCPRVVGV